MLSKFPLYTKLHVPISTHYPKTAKAAPAIAVLSSSGPLTPPATLLSPSSPITPKPSYSELAGCTPPTRWNIAKAISLSTIRQGYTKPAAYMTMELLFRKFPYSALNLPIPLPRAQAKKLRCISYINRKSRPWSRCYFLRLYSTRRISCSS